MGNKEIINPDEMDIEELIKLSKVMQKC